MNDSFTSRYEGLNNEQKSAVDATEGPVLVVAGPGSGKTELLSLRVANILRQHDVAPGNILCLTFTEAAARNMRERLQGLIGVDAHRVAIHTFHSFGADILNRYPEFFYGGASLEPADEMVQIEILEAILGELSYDSPLKTTYGEQYTYLSAIKQGIESLKKAGLSPDEFREIIEHNAEQLRLVEEAVDETFNQRLSKKRLPEVHELVNAFERVAENGLSSEPYPDLMTSLADSLRRALEEAEAQDKTTPVSEWKKTHIGKEDGKQYLKSWFYLDKLRDLATVYERYRQRMSERRYFDFADMLLDTVQEARENERLRSDLQELYEFVMVDEFQDTNDAQLRLLELLTAEQEQPNIMAVGDDDQAIFKFQGAEVSNILRFREMYPEARMITLARNYRSRQEILALARSVVLQGEERLERYYAELNKELIAAGSETDGGAVYTPAFETEEAEYVWVAGEIQRLLEHWQLAGDMAVIARSHQELQRLVPYLQQYDIPIAYEKQQNVLEEQHIVQLLQMARLVEALRVGERDRADELMAEVLSYPFWNVDRQVIWSLSLSRSEKTSSSYWIEKLRHSSRPYLREIADFFIALSQLAAYEPVEYMLDYLMGEQGPYADRGEDTYRTYGSDGMQSPFKAYYFSEERRRERPAEYFSFLSSVRVFLEAVHAHKRGTRLLLADMLEMVDRHEANGQPITDTSPFRTGTEAVELLTAHKAKGLEYGTVFVLNCTKERWMPKRKGDNLPLPPNLPVKPAGDSFDDQLRLFFVALTRAEHTLYLPRFTRDQKGKETVTLPFLAHQYMEEEVKPVYDEGPTRQRTLAESWEVRHTPPFSVSEEQLLEPVLENYQMSETHLNTFLDVTRDGPQRFLEEHLLRFPQAQTPDMAYGTAIHAAINRMYTLLQDTGELPSKDTLQHWFAEELAKTRLRSNQYSSLEAKGKDALQVFYEQWGPWLSAEHFSEFDMKHQNVRIGDAELSGKIDILVPEGENSLEVHDLKTGNPEYKWNFSQEKMLGYYRQLVFYKLLVENSREFGDAYTVSRGVLNYVVPEQQKPGTLPRELSEEAAERMARLIEIVYHKIQNLDLPSVEEYPKDAKGIQQFEEDLLAQRV
jgi:DNA helicase-2/ATP-dependent DNA helicase PcrA